MTQRQFISLFAGLMAGLGPLAAWAQTSPAVSPLVANLPVTSAADPYRGHTGSDLVLVDLDSGVAFVGGLAFAERIPTTPHANIPQWLDSLDQLEADLRAVLPGNRLRQVVPSHGPVRANAPALQQTREYLTWLGRICDRIHA